MQQRKILSVVLGGLALTACQDQRSSSEVGGELVGGAAGALLGAQIGAGTGQLAAVGAGAVIGALAGGGLARSMENNSPPAAQPTPAVIAPVVVERHTHTHSPAPEPRRQLVSREYVHTIYIDGKPKKLHGKAYMKADGSWHLYPPLSNTQ